MREIKKGIIHCLDTPSSMDAGFKEVDAWHKERGFKSPSGIHCGYHVIIRRNGNKEYGRPFHEAGAHVRGQNGDSIGIALAGGMGGFNFTHAQLVALKDEITRIEKIYPDIEWSGHNEWDDGKQCPQFDVQAWRYGR